MNVPIAVALLTITAILFSPLCPACSAAPSLAVRPHLINALEKRIGESSQVLFVRNINPGAIDVCISPWERKNADWQRIFAPVNGVIGGKGFAPPGEKREGDGTTPAGIFPLGMVFGYEPAVPTRMPYRQANVDDIWVDDIQATDYNRWAKRGMTQAVSYERMRRDDNLYKYGIVVEYNTNPVVKGYGSAIFFHLWRGKGIATAGCIALAEEDLIRILRWLDPAAKPLVVMGTKEIIGGFEK